MELEIDVIEEGKEILRPCWQSSHARDSNWFMRRFHYPITFRTAGCEPRVKVQEQGCR